MIGRSYLIRAMANAGEVPKSLRWSHGEPLSEVQRVSYLEAWKRASVRLWCSIMRLLDDWSFAWCAGPVAGSSFGFVIV